jgi:hypothetical protein
MRLTKNAFERHSSSVMLTVFLSCADVLGVNVHDDSSLDAPNNSECNFVLVIA